MGEALINGLSAGLSALITFIPKLLGFLLILLIGYLIAKGLSKAVSFLLTKVNLQGLLNRAGLSRFTASFDVGGLIVKLVFYFVLLIVLQFAFTAFGPNPVEQLLTDIIAFIPRIIVAIILVIIAATIARVVKDLILQVLAGRDFANVVSNVAYVAILVLGIIAATNQIGVATIITGPILIAVLATAGGILVVGLGGGLIKPAQARWERRLEDLDQRLANQPAGGAPTHQQTPQAPSHQQMPPSDQGSYDPGSYPPPPQGPQA